MVVQLVPVNAQRAVTLGGGVPAEAVVRVYLDTLDSAETRRTYARHLETALAFLPGGPVSGWSGADLAGYRAAVNGAPGSAALKAQRLAALRSFLRWARAMQAHNLPAEVISEALKAATSTVVRPYQVLTEAEVVRMFEVAETSRDRAILAVLLGGGLRVSELVTLDVSDIIEDQDGASALHVRSGKGRKDRIVPVQADVAALVRAYLHDTGRTLGQAGPLFRSHDRGAGKRARPRLTARAVGQLIERLTSAAGITAKQISPHALRHTYALRALRQGGNVVHVSKLLGHASVTTTQRYVDHLSLGELRAAVPLLPV